METINITPTWKGVLRVLLEVYSTAKTSEARNTALAELTRMAELADAYVAEHKAAE